MKKRLYLMRGLPGSGKSFAIRRAIHDCGWNTSGVPELGLGRYPVASDAKIFSADDAFMVDGVYRFDSARIPFAHRECFRKFIGAVSCESVQPECIIVDNTGICAWELSPYCLAGEALGYDVTIVEMRFRNVRVCAERNLHGVPLRTIERMAESLRMEFLPHWWKRIRV